MLIPTDPIWIDQHSELAELCQQWRQQGAVAVDTEFMRTSTFYPIAGLIQIGDGKGCYLLDPLAIEDLTPLKELFLDQAVTKVLHSCSEDLEVFQRLLGVVPEPLFDTQIAAAFAGYGFSIGYAGLVNAVLGIDVPKGETRSDWLQRPLSVPQLKYAALDVAHMLIVYGKLLQNLKTSERLQWVRDDCAELVVNARQSPDFNDYYKKVGSAWKLRPQELAVLRSLCAWREAEARTRDIPRNRLVKENALWELARKQPYDLSQLDRISDLPARTQKEDGETLLQIIRAAMASDESSWPDRLPAPLGQAEAPLLKSLKSYVREQAEQQDILPELLVRKKEYEFIIRSGMGDGDFALPQHLTGWRYAVIGEGLLAQAQQSLKKVQEAEAHENNL
jgi:ribonuclease D